MKIHNVITDNNCEKIWPEYQPATVRLTEPKLSIFFQQMIQSADRVSSLNVYVLVKTAFEWRHTYVIIT